MKKIMALGILCGANVFAQGVDYKYDFGARLEYDIANFYMADDDYDDNKLRRARISHEGSFFDKSLFYELEVDLANYTDDDEENDVEFKDNFIGYKNKIKSADFNYRFKLGNMKVPFGLDAYSGSKNSTFMESPLLDTFTQAEKLV